MSRAASTSSSAGREFPEGEPAAPGGAGQVYGEGLGEMGDEREARLEAADPDSVLRAVFAEVERLFDQVLVAPRADDLAEGLGGAAGSMQLGASGVVGARPAVDRNRLLARSVGERVGVGDEIEEVIRMQVGDQHRVDVDVIAMLAQLAEDAVAAVEQQDSLVIVDQVAATGPAGVLPRRQLAQDGEPHSATLIARG